MWRSQGEVTVGLSGAPPNGGQSRSRIACAESVLPESTGSAEARARSCVQVIVP
jgi:hypothetical protein